MANADLALAGRSKIHHRSFTRERILFGYSLLAPAMLYMTLLVGVPFFFSLYLALSDASVGNQVASYVGLGNFFAIFRTTRFAWPCGIPSRSP
jgi:ABC-type sugar transport system permease subunit